MNLNTKHAKSDNAGGQGWKFLGVVAMAVLLPLTGCRKGPPLTLPPTPTPVRKKPTPTPTPVVVKATPEPTPMPVVVAATPAPAPTPTPPPLDLATVARTSALWPMQVTLTTANSFPVVINGRAVGEVKTPPGTVLKLLRVLGAQVEVEYQNGVHVVPAASTDLMPRALAISKNPALGRPTPAPAPVMAMAGLVAPPVVTELASAAIAQRVTVDVARVKKSRVEGADRDDRKESIELKVRLTNTDSSKTASRLKGDVFIFADSLADRSAVKLLGTHPIDCSIKPRSTHEFITPEVTTTFDAGARYGFKYDSWFLRIRDSEGKDLLVKSNSPTFLRNAAKIDGLAAGKTYERSTFKPKDVAR